MNNKPSIHKQKHTDIVSLTLKLNADKINIQTKLDAGAPITDMATAYGVTATTLSKILKQMGFANVGRQGKRDNGKLFGDMLIVVARLARELNVNHDEIKPYV